MWQYPNPDWTFFAPHFAILLAVVKMHCLYANAVVQPSVQHYRGPACDVLSRKYGGLL